MEEQCIVEYGEKSSGDARNHAAKWVVKSFFSFFLKIYELGHEVES